MKRCERCDTEMKLGVALWPWVEANTRYHYTVPASELKAVLKCPSCGKSEPLDADS